MPELSHESRSAIARRLTTEATVAKYVSAIKAEVDKRRPEDDGLHDCKCALRPGRCNC
jgi:hypothetical protein